MSFQIARIAAVLAMCIVAMAGCRSSEEAKDVPGAKQSRVSSIQPEIDFVDLRLAPQQPPVTTVQLYRGNQEVSLPVLPLRTRETLMLEFDLLHRDGRSLRIEFQHANRRWQDDFLNPTLFMDHQSSDNITQFRETTAPSSTYTHYEYRFPNQTIDFKLSGNYVLTVLDPTLDDPVLFERPFVVTEESAEVAYELRAVPMPGAGGVWNQPYLLLDPRPFPNRDMFDYGACFVKNTRFDLSRCAGHPSLFQTPYFSFELDPRASFEPEPDLHLVDISELRSGIGIEDILFDVEPLQVNLVPDLADMGSPEPSIQNGQSAIRTVVLDLVYPEYESEYVMAQFTYIPYREKRARGPVMILGSFNGWTLNERNTLAWIEEEKQYRGLILLKQGRHAYQYFVSGSRPPSQGTFAPVSSYTALLYYFDPVEHTDRLIAVRSLIAP